MAEYQLQIASRQIRRQFARAIGKSIPKILTELITNADDSYRRLVDGTKTDGETYNIEDPAPITIIFERGKRIFRVIDNAEGLTDKEMTDRFVTYGQESHDRQQGFKTRSLFGKGLRDVLFTQTHGQVKSIKNGLFYNCRFRWKEEDGHERPIVDIRHPAKITSELRQAMGIPVNGTDVEFILEKDIHEPQPEKLVENISRFYMLRSINSNPHRKVILKVFKKGKLAMERQLHYKYPEIEVVKKLGQAFTTDTGATIRIEGEVGLTETELSQGEVGYVEREGGLLVFDEDEAVLDLCLFGFDEDPAARRISGTIRLIGAGSYIRTKLNQKDPEEVLTESRDGFDQNHPFYRLLRDQIRPHLEPIVDKLRDQGPLPKSKLSERTQEKHQQALDLLNRLANEMLGKIGRAPVIPSSLRKPPPDGIAFVNTHISIQTGVTTPTALLINRALVRPDDTIEITSDHPAIIVSPRIIRIGNDESVDEILIKMVRIDSEVPDIKGTLDATWRQSKTQLEVTTTAREVLTPSNGIEFERDEYNVRKDAKRHLRLFVDTEKVPIGSEIAFAADESILRLPEKNVTVQNVHLVTERIAQIEIAVSGLVTSRETTMDARSLTYSASTKVSVVKKEKTERGKHGMFKDYKFQPLGRKAQSQFVDGFILINTKDPVNERYFGQEPYQAVEEHGYCQVRLADLILNECLQMMVTNALDTGKLDRRFPNNPEIDVRTYVDEKKFDIGPQIHSLFVTKV